MKTQKNYALWTELTPRPSVELGPMYENTQKLCIMGRTHPRPSVELGPMKTRKNYALWAELTPVPLFSVELYRPYV